MLQLSFKQTKQEMLVRAAATILFGALKRAGCQSVPLSQLTEPPQYGVTASATITPIGPKFVRITDLQAGKIDWGSVPYCKCDDPNNYVLKPNDILFARTGATTGKTHLVRNPEFAVFASYLIRLRANERVRPEYLFGFFHSDFYWSQIVEEKEGSAQPNVNGRKLWSIEMPLADPRIQLAVSNFLQIVRARQHWSTEELPALPELLSEQRRIVARIEELAAKIEEARRLRKEVQEECENLCRAIVLAKSVKETPMREVVRLRECDVAVTPEETYEFAGVYCFGGGVFKGLRKSGAEFAYTRLTRLKAGNFVYPKLMAWEGALGVVPPSCDGLVVSPEFPVFEIDENRALPETLDVYFRTPSVWPELAEISTGTNVRRRRLHPSAFLNYAIPLPRMETQLRLLRVRQIMDAEMKNLQFETVKELDALLPSILSKAFAGEL